MKGGGAHETTADQVTLESLVIVGLSFISISLKLENVETAQNGNRKNNWTSLLAHSSVKYKK